MLGRTVDKKLLRLISHSRNIKTEEQIEAEAEDLARTGTYVASDEDFVKATTRAGAHLDWKGKKILDVGCGRGDLANHLAMNGAVDVCGIDLQNQHIKVAQSFARSHHIPNVRFVEADFHRWVTEERFDCVVSYESLDHIPDTRATLAKMASLMKEDGKLIVFTGGFWKGPLGADHCDDFFYFVIPWRQLLFNEQALFDLVKERYRPTHPSTSFKEIRGGLTQYTLTDFTSAIRAAGLKVIRWDVNYQLRYKLGGVLRPVSEALWRLPGVGEYFVFSVLSVMTR
jgi:ubiquinone/menaquinone biosynthesis C-methylase UbiE